MIIVLVRHAETIQNAGRVVQGQMQGHLTKVGKRQAKELGRKLLIFGKFDRIYSSNLKRAVETTNILAAEIPPCRILIEKGIGERCYGVAQGHSFYRLKRLLVEKKTDIRTIQIPEIEKYEDFELRITKFYRQLIGDRENQKVILVTHAGVMQVIIERILRSTWSDVSNCEGFLLDISFSQEIRLQRI